MLGLKSKCECAPLVSDEGSWWIQVGLSVGGPTSLLLEHMAHSNNNPIVIHYNSEEN